MMFTLCKSRYQAVLLKQSLCAVYQTAGSKYVSSAVTWNYAIFNEVLRCNSAESPFYEAYSEKRRAVSINVLL